MVPTRLVTAFALTLLAAANVTAGVMININPSGSDVLATWSGTLNTAGLSNTGTSSITGYVNPASGWFALTGISSNYQALSPVNFASVTVPGNFGSGTLTNVSSGSGVIGFVPNSIKYIFVPVGYTSGSSLTGSATWNSTTLAGLGLSTGTFVWSWSNFRPSAFTPTDISSGSISGGDLNPAVLPPGDSITMVVSNTDIGGVPEPGTFGLLGIAGLTLAAVARRRAA